MENKEIKFILMFIAFIVIFLSVIDNSKVVAEMVTQEKIINGNLYENLNPALFEDEIVPQEMISTSLIPEFAIDNISPVAETKISSTNIATVAVKKAPVKKPAISKSIGLPAPILAETKVVGGRNVCKDDNDKPKKSSKNPKGHIDGECCLDPGETPNSLCYYPQEKYGKFIQQYLNRKK